MNLQHSLPSAQIQTLGDFELGEKIGQGGMGVVFAATQTSLNRRVALKVMQSIDGIDGRQLERFQIEAAAIAALRHQNVVTVYDAGIESGYPYLAMELIGESTLSKLITQQAPLSNKRAVKIVLGICNGISHAHEQQILHRDIKPSNVLLTEDESPVVADFGMAKLLERHHSLTDSNQLMCTPAYASPEQAAGKSADHRSDVYSIGAVLYACVTGRPPFNSDSPANTLRLVLEAEPVSPAKLNPGVDRDLNTIICKCLEKESEQRYPSCESLIADLERYGAGRPILASPPGFVKKILKAARREPRQAFAYSIAILGTLAAILVLLASRSRLERALDGQTAERQRAEQNLEMAQQAIGNSLQLIADNPKMNNPGMRQLKVEVLESISGYLDEMSNQAPGDPQLRYEAATILSRAATMASALGDFESSLTRTHQASDLLAGLVEEYPDEERYRSRLGGALITVANREIQSGKFEDAKLHLREANRHFGALPSESGYETFHNFCTSQLLLANLLRNEGKLDAASDLYRQIVRMRTARGNYGQNMRGIALARANLGAIYYDQDRTSEAILEYELAADILRDATHQMPNNANALSRLAKNSVDLSALYIDTGQIEKAKSILADAIVDLQLLFSREPKTYRHEVRLANALHRMAICVQQEQRDQEALDYIQQAVKHFDALAASVPQDKSTQLNADEARSLLQDLLNRQ